VANAISCVPAGVVDVCLIPEVKFDLQGDRGLLKFVQGLLDEKGHCVVCIAEGAGQVCASPVDLPGPASGLQSRSPPAGNSRASAARLTLSEGGQQHCANLLRQCASCANRTC
jgi:6-phosphofructokinase